MTDLFCELVCVAIGTLDSLSRVPTNREWEKLYGIARKQSLVGVCFAGVQKLCKSESGDYCGMNEMQYLTWMGMAAKISQNHDNMKALEQKLDALFKERGVKAVLVKGASIATYYGEPKLRQFGDIDIYSPNDYEAINGIIKPVASEYNEEYYRHSEARVDNVMVENHKFLTDVRGQSRWEKLEQYLSTIASAKLALVTKGGVTYPDNMLTLLFFVYHAQAHFIFEKISLKFLVDWCVLLQRTEVPKKVLAERLQEFGLMRFAAMLTRVCVGRLGLRAGCVPDAVEAMAASFSENDVNRFEADIFCYDHVGFSSNSLKDRIERGREFYRNRWKIEEFLGESIYKFLWNKMVSIATFKK